MIKIIKKISYGLIALLIIAVVFILLAIKLNWDIGSGFIPVFGIILILTLLSMTIVSVAQMLKAFRKDRKKLLKTFFIRWGFFFLMLCATAFLKKDAIEPMLLATSLALAVFSFCYSDAEA
ncbi:hypothetical protein ACS3UN_10235 [Oscillospiraceae bacterium LTW-04]|nr:hypothetical protein RBH76_11985 [Oscillospiraceae bacterium MB24-C1]